MLGVFVSGWPAVILVAALPEIGDNLHASASTLSWVLSLPMLIGAVMLPTFGRLGDLKGQRRVFLIGLTVCGLAALLTSLSWNAGSLILFRTISQTAGFATAPTAVALIMETFPLETRPRALGMWAFVSAAAPALGLAFGGPMVEALSWRGVFIAQGVLALLFLPMCLRWLDETKRRSNIGFDVLGGITLMLATGSILLYLDRGGTWGWTSPVELGLLLAAPLLGFTFLRVEKMAKFPLLPAGLLRNPAYSMPAVSEFLSQASSNAVFFSAPLLLTQRFGKSVAETAFLMLPLPLGMCFGAIIGGRVAARFGERRGGLIGTTSMALSMVLFLAGYTTEIMFVVTVALIVQGVANGFVRPAVASAGGAALSPDYFGVGMATLRMIALLGSTMGISIALAAKVIGGFRGIYITTFALAVMATLAMTRVVSHERITGTPEERRAQERARLAEMETEAGLTTLPAFEG